MLGTHTAATNLPGSLLTCGVKQDEPLVCVVEQKTTLHTCLCQIINIYLNFQAGNSAIGTKIFYILLHIYLH